MFTEAVSVHIGIIVVFVVVVVIVIIPVFVVVVVIFSDIGVVFLVGLSFPTAFFGGKLTKKR